MRRGPKTTEFWILMIVQVALTGLQAFQGEVNEGAAIGQAVAAAIYAVSRTLLKKQE